MATDCSILAWRIPRTEEPGGLQSMVLQRVGHDCIICTFTFSLSYSEIDQVPSKLPGYGRCSVNC